MLFLNYYYSYSYIHISSSSSFSPNPKNNNNLNHHKPLSIPNNNNSHSHDHISIIKSPTPPWIKSPLHLQPQQHLLNSNVEKSDLSDKALNSKEISGKKVLRKIAHKVEKLHKALDSEKNETLTQMGSEKVENFGDCLDILMENEEVVNKGRMPWEKDEKIGFFKVKREKTFSAADLNVDKVVLHRLRGEAARMRKWVKVKKIGVTQDVVDEIKRSWRMNELAMVKFDIPLCQNMGRAREIVEVRLLSLYSYIYEFSFDDTRLV